MRSSCRQSPPPQTNRLSRQKASLCRSHRDRSREDDPARLPDRVPELQPLQRGWHSLRAKVHELESAGPECADRIRSESGSASELALASAKFHNASVRWSDHLVDDGKPPTSN